MDAEIPGYTKGHIIKRFKELAATATGLAYDIIPGAPTDYVLRKQIQKAARSRRSNWPLSKKWPERKTQVIQLWAATWWGRYYTESVTKGTTAVPPPYLTVEEEQAALLNSVTPTHTTRVPDPPTPPVQRCACRLPYLLIVYLLMLLLPECRRLSVFSYITTAGPESTRTAHRCKTCLPAPAPLPRSLDQLMFPVLLKPQRFRTLLTGSM